MRDNPERSRFELQVNGEVAYADYRRQPGTLVIAYVYAPPALRGTGTAPETAVDMLYERRNLARGPHVVTLGGGTGMSNLLSGLRAHTGNTTAIVPCSSS